MQSPGTDFNSFFCGTHTRNGKPLKLVLGGTSNCQLRLRKPSSTLTPPSESETKHQLRDSNTAPHETAINSSPNGTVPPIDNYALHNFTYNFFFLSLLLPYCHAFSIDIPKTKKYVNRRTQRMKTAKTFFILSF